MSASPASVSSPSADDATTRSAPEGMRTLRLGARFTHVSSVPVHAIVHVEHTDPNVQTLETSWQTTPFMPMTGHRDLVGNLGHRMMLPAGESVFEYAATVLVPDELDAQDPSVRQASPAGIPDETLPYLLPSRYCQSDLLSNDAWRLFGSAEPTLQRVIDVQDWVWNNLEYRTGSTGPDWTALDAFTERYGICRDFAHTMVALCRALNLPARYVAGYLPDMDVPPLPIAMDFHAWCEVYLGDRWWTFDPRHNERRKGHVVISRGRDAADCALVTSFGSPWLKRMIVTCEELGAEPAETA